MTDFERLRTALAGRGGSRAAFLYGFDLLEEMKTALHGAMTAVDGHDYREAKRLLDNLEKRLIALIREQGGHVITTDD